MTEMANWAPPQPERGQVGWTRTWRILTYGAVCNPASRIYIALTPAWLREGYEAVFPLLDSRAIPHRHARSPEALCAAEAHPAWAGKAVVIEAPSDALAHELDGLLAGRGLSGPSALPCARPFGGQSGLVFIRREHADMETEARRKLLAKLLGD